MYLTNPQIRVTLISGARGCAIKGSYLRGLLGGTERFVAFMLSVFGDESADETKQRVFTVAGVIGSDAQWGELEQKWVARTGGIPFHANHCDSDRGDYANTPHDQNKALYKDLAILLAESRLGGWGIAIDLVGLRRVFPDAPDIAYYKGFVEVLEHMRNCATYNRETVKFTFDQRRESDSNAGFLYGLFRQMPEWERVTFSEIAFACSRTHPKVQVADLFAREVMKVFDNRFGPVRRPPRRSWNALRATDRFHVEAIGEPWFASLKERMPALKEETGMSGGRYRQWLKDKNCQHCTTAMFRFMEWTERVGELKP